MNHTFNVEVATKYGVHAAVLLENIGFWIAKNEANGVNYHDGYYWTYNSRKAFSELFPYMTKRQVDTAMQKLIDGGLIITGNYNALAYDRTLWYALTKKGKSILHFCEMEGTENVNGNSDDVKPIPDNKPGKKPSENTDKNIGSEFEALWKIYPRKFGKQKALKAYQKARKNGVTYEQVKSGIEAYNRQITAKKTELEYVKHGSTWFNGECWNDDYTTGGSAGRPESVYEDSDELPYFLK